MTDQTRHPQTIIDYTQFKNTMFQVGVIYDDSDTPSRICRYEYREDGWYRCTMDQYPDGDRELAQDPSHFPLRLVSEPAPAPVEPTDEQRAAVEWLQSVTSDTYSPRGEAGHAQTLLAALPDNLTNPRPPLPTEPGRYEDRHGDSGWLVHDDGTWHHNGSASQVLTRVQNAAPFRRLVRERPQVTMEDLTRVYAEHTGARGVPITLARALLKLANGTPDE